MTDRQAQTLIKLVFVLITVEILGVGFHLYSLYDRNQIHQKERFVDERADKRGRASKRALLWIEAHATPEDAAEIRSLREAGDYPEN